MKKPFDEYTHQYDLWFDTKGRFAGFLNIKFGVDPSANSLKLAKGRVKNLVCGYAEDLIPRAFSEIGRILKVGGKLILGFVPRNTCIGEFYVYKGLGGHRFYKYAKFFTEGEIERIANSEGLLIRGDLGQSLR
jgi:hypothetical protein